LLCICIVDLFSVLWLYDVSAAISTVNDDDDYYYHYQQQHDYQLIAQTANSPNGYVVLDPIIGAFSATHKISLF